MTFPHVPPASAQVHLHVVSSHHALGECAGDHRGVQYLVTLIHTPA